MALLIVDDCTACDACKPVCPNEAISVGSPIYVIDPAKCTECVGAHDTPKCVELCPVDGCIVADPAHQESREAMQAHMQGGGMMGTLGGGMMNGTGSMNTGTGTQK